MLIANNKNEEKILFPARGLNRDRRIPLSRAYYVFALTSCHSATPAEWITRVVHLPHSGETTTAERDDLHYKSSFLVKNKGQWNAKSGPKAAYLNFAMRTKFSGRLETK